MNQNVGKNIELLTPELLLEAYSGGYFPMADDEDGKIYWYSPNPRAVFPIYDLKIPRSFKQTLKKSYFTYTINHDFDFVIRACAERDNTWISEDIIELYKELNRLGFAVSFETWQKGKIVGGLYGVSIGKAFFGESMFTKVSGGSKAAFYYLVEVLKHNNYLLLDSQFINPHTELLGAIQIPKQQYMQLLDLAINS